MSKARFNMTVWTEDERVVSDMDKLANANNRSRSAEALVAIQAHLAAYREAMRTGAKMPDGKKRKTGK